jgi:polysaccharide biosynthesis/export protein
MGRKRAMNRVNRGIVIALACFAQLISVALVAAAAQETGSRTAVASPGPAEATKSGTADGKRSPALTGSRRPLYRLRVTDVLEIHFTFTPEFDQTVTVQPDGYIALRALAELRAEGMTVLELREAVRQAYAEVLHDPEVTVTLKEFDKPYFIASGQVARPGKYELREDLTVAEAIALAGGFNEQAKHSQVVLFRHVSPSLVESHLLNIKSMLNSRSLAEDVYLQPGDFVFVPQNAVSKMRRYLPASNLGLYSTPTQF